VTAAWRRTSFARPDRRGSAHAGAAGERRSGRGPLPRANDAVTGIPQRPGAGPGPERLCGAGPDRPAAHGQGNPRPVPRRPPGSLPGALGTRMPSVLVEIGFILAPARGPDAEPRPLPASRVAQALAGGVHDFAEQVLSRRLVAQARASRLGEEGGARGERRRPGCLTRPDAISRSAHAPERPRTGPAPQRHYRPQFHRARGGQRPLHVRADAGLVQRQRGRAVPSHVKDRAAGG